MKRNWLKFLMVGLLSMLLIACGSSGDKDNKSSHDKLIPFSDLEINKNINDEFAKKAYEVVLYYESFIYPEEREDILDSLDKTKEHIDVEGFFDESFEDGAVNGFTDEEFRLLVLTENTSNLRVEFNGGLINEKEYKDSFYKLRDEWVETAKTGLYVNEHENYMEKSDMYLSDDDEDVSDSSDKSIDVTVDEIRELLNEETFKGATIPVISVANDIVDLDIEFDKDDEKENEKLAEKMTYDIGKEMLKLDGWSKLSFHFEGVGTVSFDYNDREVEDEDDTGYFLKEDIKAQLK